MKRMICSQIPQIHTQLIETDSVKQISWFFFGSLKRSSSKKKKTHWFTDKIWFIWIIIPSRFHSRRQWIFSI